MSGNSFGKLFKIHTFGESHGKGIGLIIDGCPSGLELAEEDIQHELDRRRPGQSHLSTQRKEKDKAEIMSGLFEGKTTGHPIGILIRNEDQRSKDYDHLKSLYRPSHADFTHEKKYGLRDYRGGGRSSARETAARVAGGAIAKKLLQHYKVDINAWVSAVGQIETEPGDEIEHDFIESNPIRTANKSKAAQMETAIENARIDGDSLGGVIVCSVHNCPIGLGEPVFDRLEADFAKAMLSIPATKGFEIGSGFAAARMKGSEHNDAFVKKGAEIGTASNHSGGVQGGISNGQEIAFRVAFKPVATINKKQQTVDESGQATSLEAKGRHDPCVVPRAVPIVEAMCALVLADHLLRHRSTRL